MVRSSSRALAVLGLALGLVGSASAQAPTTPTPPRVGDGTVTIPADAPEGTPDPNNPGDQLFFRAGLVGKKGRRVIRELRVIARDVPAVAFAVRKTLPDGTEDLFIVYDVSLFNQCVFDQNPQGRDGTRAAREACVGTRGVEAMLAHVRIAPTPRGRAEDVGGAITIVAQTSLGQRGTQGRDLSEQTFIVGMGAIDVGSGSAMRVWVSRVEAQYEGEYGRGERLYGFYASYAQSLTMFDDQLEAVDTFALEVNGMGEGVDMGNRRELNNATFPVPTLAYTSARRRLDVHVANETLAYAYDAEGDRFDPIPAPRRR